MGKTREGRCQWLFRWGVGSCLIGTACLFGLTQRAERKLISAIVSVLGAIEFTSKMITTVNSLFLIVTATIKIV